MTSPQETHNQLFRDIGGCEVLVPRSQMRAIAERADQLMSERNKVEDVIAVAVGMIMDAEREGTDEARLAAYRKMQALLGREVRRALLVECPFCDPEEGCTHCCMTGWMPDVCWHRDLPTGGDCTRPAAYIANGRPLCVDHYETWAARSGVTP